MSFFKKNTLAVALLAAAFLVACGPPRPDLPDVVRITVEKPKPLPAWATDPLPVPQPASGTVQARIESHDARGAVIELANCHRALAARLSRGETVDATQCGPEGPL